MSLPKAGGGDRNVVRHSAKRVEAERPHAVDLGFDCLAIKRGARHAGHATLRPGLPLRFGGISFTMTR